MGSTESDSSIPTALALQGGAMRSIYCLGAVQALMERGALGAVSGVYASSAGCVAGLLYSFSGGRPEEFKRMSMELQDRVANPRFIDPRRVRRIVDVDYLVDCMLSVTNVSDSNISTIECSLEISLTNTLGAPEYFTIDKDSSIQEVRSSLIATMAIPIMYPPRAMIHGRQFFDGGISDPLPVLRALEDGVARRVWAISSVAPGLLGRPASRSEGRIVRLVPGLPSSIRYQMLGKNSLGAYTDRVLTRGAFAGVELKRVAPAAAEDMGSRLDVQRDHLSRLSQLGYQDAVAAADAELHAP